MSCHIRGLYILSETKKCHKEIYNRFIKAVQIAEGNTGLGALTKRRKKHFREKYITWQIIVLHKVWKPRDVMIVQTINKSKKRVKGKLLLKYNFTLSSWKMKNNLIRLKHSMTIFSLFGEGGGKKNWIRLWWFFFSLLLLRI